MALIKVCDKCFATEGWRGLIVLDLKYCRDFRLAHISHICTNCANAFNIWAINQNRRYRFLGLSLREPYLCFEFEEWNGNYEHLTTTDVEDYAFKNQVLYPIVKVKGVNDGD